MKPSAFFILFPLFATSILSFAQTKAINFSRFVSIGGIEQWITISGDDKTKPAILFLHGGPGSTMSQYNNAMFRGWEKDFILINWDQRGAGRTYGRNAPAELDETFLASNPLTVDQMANDGIELTRYLLKYLKKKKIVLVGSSWGSILGTEMALRNPDLFFAYVGHAQVVNPSRNLEYAYEKTYALAVSNKDSTSVKMLESLGEPPYAQARTFGQLMRVVKKYERMKATAPPEEWFEIAASYDNDKDEEDRNNGDDYSFVNFAGDQKLGLKSMVSEIDFNATGVKLGVPFFIIQGELDILTPSAITRPYFDKVEAPKKKYFLLPDAAHSFNKSVIDTLHQILKNQISY